MINSYKEDEKIKKVAGAKTVLRLLSFLLTYRIQVAVVLFLIALGTGVSLLNPLFMELGIDRYISSGNVNGFIKLLVIALSVNVIKTIAVKIQILLLL